MIDTVVVQPRAETGEPAVAGVSWAAVAAGAVASCALTLVVLAFGVGLGLSVVSPWGGAGVSATTFKIGTGLYLVVVAMLSSSIGGYLAGRLRTRWIGVHGEEVYFRDTAHGFIAWAFATVIGAALLATPASSLIGGTASGAGCSANSFGSIALLPVDLRLHPIALQVGFVLLLHRDRQVVDAIDDQTLIGDGGVHTLDRLLLDLVRVCRKTEDGPGPLSDVGDQVGAQDLDQLVPHPCLDLVVISPIGRSLASPILPFQAIEPG